MHNDGAILDFIPSLIEMELIFSTLCKPRPRGWDPKKLKDQFGKRLVFGRFVRLPGSKAFWHARRRS